MESITVFISIKVSQSRIYVWFLDKFLVPLSFLTYSKIFVTAIEILPFEKKKKIIIIISTPKNKLISKCTFIYIGAKLFQTYVSSEPLAVSLITSYLKNLKEQSLLKVRFLK